MYFTNEEVELLKVIFMDNAVYEYIDYEDENCPYKKLWDKVVGKDNEVNDINK